MRISAFGASVGSGPVHCVLLSIEDGHVVDRQARTIDPGPYRLGRRGNLLSSGFDLLTSHANGELDASAVTVRTRRDLLSVRLGARGGVRSAGLVPEAEAALRGLGERGSIARYGTALVADLAVEGLRLYTVHDGALAATRRTRAVVADGHGGAPTDHVAALVRSAIAGAADTPEALAMIGPGAQNAAVRDAVSAVARDAGMEPVEVEEPEAIAATGAALLAADRRAAGKAPSTLVGSGIGVLGGHSIRLTAAILPLLVVAALTGAVVATGYATGIIGPAARSTDETVPTSSETVTGDAPRISEEPITTVPSTTLPPRPPVPPTVPPEAGREEVTVTPTMTTFAPPPVIATTTRPPSPTTPTSPPTSTTGTLPTTILPSIPTGPSSGASSSEKPSDGVAVRPSGSGEPPRPAPGNGLVAPGAAGVPPGAADAPPSPESTTPAI